MKLRTKVFFIFTLLALIPLVLFTLFAYDRYTQVISERIDELSGSLFENAVEQTNDTLSTIQQTAGLFTFYSDSNFSIINNLEKFSDPDGTFDFYEQFETNQNIKFICQNVFYSYDYIYGLYVFTPSGAILGHSSGKNGDIYPGYNPQKESWYQAALSLDGGLYVSSSRKHDIFTGTRETIFFAQKLKDIYSHEFLGVLMIACNPEILDLSIINTMPDIALLTIDNSSTLEVLYSNIDQHDFNFQDSRSKTMHAKLAVSPLVLTAVFDYDTLFHEFNVTGILFVLLGLSCGSCIIFLTWLLSKSLIQPIEHLSRKMASQRGHSLDASTQYLNRTDEIGTLYNEYNSMVEELNTSVKRDYQDKLILLDAQMKSLEARINSHFLFNTLESINSMAELEDNEQIATMSLALGNMFRYSIKTESELVPLIDELSHVKDYVSIQQLRFSNRFSLEIKLDEALLSQPVLKLILQPLVENALYHGLNYCTTGDLISISGQINQDSLFLSVHDNGQGISAEQLRDIQNRLQEEASFTELGHRNKQSIGLKNIHSRIELYYGRGFGLMVESVLGEGTTIQIKLPIITKEKITPCTPT